MKTTILLGAAALVASLSCANAQTAGAFYIVRDSAAKKCMIVDKKPVGTTTVTVAGDGTVYKTRTEAESAIKTTKVCSEM
ncbi:MAG: hypothetical protein U1E28_14905 [Beijerinckiaceae bacterium]